MIKKKKSLWIAFWLSIIIVKIMERSRVIKKCFPSIARKMSTELQTILFPRCRFDRKKPVIIAVRRYTKQQITPADVYLRHTSPINITLISTIPKRHG